MPILPFSFSPPLSPTTLTVINLLGPLITMVIIMEVIMVMIRIFMMMVIMITELTVVSL